MPLFREKADCPSCGATVKPSDPADFLCPRCEKPGPWASDEQRSGSEQAEEERQRYFRLQEVARQQLRRRAFEQAASLTPIEVPGFIAQKSEQVYFTMPAKLAEWKEQRGHYEGGLASAGSRLWRRPECGLGRRPLFV